VYTRPGCHLCVEAMSELRRLQDELGFALSERDIDGDDALQRAYFERIPVVALDGEELFDFYVDEAALRERLESRR
jgi:glutaredoxin